MTRKLTGFAVGMMIVLSAFGGLFMVSQPAEGFTRVTGVVSGVWDAAGSPYYIESPILVLLGSKLEIDASAGPIDIFVNGSQVFQVDGRIYVNGTATNRVTFTSNSTTPAAGDWDGFNLNIDTSLFEFRHCDIEYTTSAITSSGANAGYVLDDVDISDCTNNAIRITNGDFGNITDCHITNVSLGVWISNGAENWTMDGCSVSNAGNRGIYAQGGSHNFTVNNVSVDNVGTIGIQLEDSDDCSVNGGSIYDGASGIYVYLSDRATIQDMNISEQSNDGVPATDSNDITIINNEFFHCAANGGVYMNGCDGGLIDGNDIVWCHFGAELMACTYVKVSNNTMRDGNNGFRFRQNGCHNNTLENNLIWHNVLDVSLSLANGAVDNVIRWNTIGGMTNPLGYAVFSTQGQRNLITENVIRDNPCYGVYLTNTAADNFVYHNSFFNNTIHAFDDTGANFWNTTYSQSPLAGGNFWDNYTGVDTMNGANQDVAGSDGIGDTPYTWIEGGAGVVDNYPLTEPYGGIPPESEVDPVSSYWHNGAASLTATASDVGSGVKEVSLWYRFAADNSTWGAWTLFGTDIALPWNWNFNFPPGDGYYQLYSIAEDNSSYLEGVPATADRTCAYDQTAPASSADPVTEYNRTGASVLLNLTASDLLSGVYGVSLWYRHSADNTTWGGWLNFATDTVLPWSISFDYPDGDGYYEFYSRATDNAGNAESAPATADTGCALNATTSTDVTPPVSMVPMLPGHWFTTPNMTVNATASDDGSGVDRVALFFRHSLDNTTWGYWEEYDFDDVAPYSWDFNFTDGSGYYEFASIARDFAGNVEDAPPLADARAKFDDVAPTSQLQPLDNYWLNDNAGISFSALADDDVSGVYNAMGYYRFSADNSTWGSWTLGTGLQFTEGEGYYEVYSIAVDNASNVEPAPATADTGYAYDSTAPTLSVTAASNGTAGLDFSISATVSDVAIDTVRLTYRFGGGANTTVAMSLAGGVYAYSLPLVDGNYTLHFSIEASDKAGNSATSSGTATITQPAGPPDDDDDDDMEDQAGFPWWIIILIIVVVVVLLVVLLSRRKGADKMVEKMDQQDGFKDAQEVEEELGAQEEEPAPEESLE